MTIKTVFSVAWVKPKSIYMALLPALYLLAPNVTIASNLDTVLAADKKGISADQRAVKQLTANEESRRHTLQSLQQIRQSQRLADHYQKQLGQQIEQAKNALDSIAEQQMALRKVKMALNPLIQNMFTTLENMHGADLPFLQQERTARIEVLREQLADPSIDEATKLGRILDAYQVELSYGNSVESWTGKLASGQLVDFLRVGRLGYYYLTPDRSESAVWEPNKGWVPLSQQQTHVLENAVHSTKNTGKPALFTLPTLSQ